VREGFARVAGLSRCAAELAFGEDRPALAAHSLLHLVGHACPLPDHVGCDLVMPVGSCSAKHVHSGVSDEVLGDRFLIPSDGGAAWFVGARARLYTFDTSFTCAPDSDRLRARVDAAARQPGQDLAFDARGVVGDYRKPGGRTFTRFGARNANGVRTVFAGTDAVLGARCTAAWYRVLLPMNPNGSAGYVRATRVKVRIVRSRLVIDLSSRRVTVYDSGRLALTTSAAIGAPSTPTPLGRFYINQRFRDDPNGPYGWAAIGITAFSEVLTGWPQGGPLGLHGTNRPSQLGLRVSNGCIRVSNAAIRRIWRLVPTGTSVLIRA
jgi:L,D-transpeptidase catalytic domain